MTTTDTANKYRYEGNGVTDTFAFSGRVFAETDLVVELITRATDVLAETLTINTHYTVTIATDGTASVEVTSAPKIPSVTQDILLRRVLPQSQSISLPTGTPFPAKVVETALDRVTALVQDLDEQISRSIKLPAQTSATTALTVEPEDGAILAWDGTTGLLQNGPNIEDFEAATTAAEDAATAAAASASSASTSASTATTQASLATSQKTYAQEWAQNPEDDAVSVAAGGDNSTTFSALHWAAKAEDFAQSINLPALGAANTVLQVNAAGDGQEYEKVKALNVDINAATDVVITASDEIWFADATDSNLVKKDTVQGILDLVPVSANPLGGGYATNRYYSGGAVDFDSGTTTVTANRMYGIPFIVSTAATFTRIGIRVSTGAAGNARLGIYNCSNGAPSTLVLDCGTVSTAAIAEVEVTISQALSPGVYFLAAVFSATPGVRSVSGYDGGMLVSLLGNTDSAAGTPSYGLYTAHTYGALPTPFGTPTYAQSMPIIWLRVV